ncbi:hypothetical protein AMTRI_Chr06g197470 [Amborella trichopoda]
MDLVQRGQVCAVLFVVLFFRGGSCSPGVLRVQHKFKGLGKNLTELKSHDARRHGRILSAIDVHLGGDGDPTNTGLYYAQIKIGNPAKDYYVQIDTGSDILWVNCIQCTRCPKKSGLGVHLTLYDPSGSSSGNPISCADPFCSIAYQGPIQDCTPDVACPYGVEYGDGSTTSGFYVQDYIQYERVSGNFQTTPANASVVFGCGAHQSGQLGKDDQALDGIFGFGQANSSVISQLASSGKVKKMFAHCLDGIHGGGIFSIGQVVQPSLKTTPLVPNQPHYNVNLKAIDVGGSVLDLPSNVFGSGDGQGTIIDSGTTLAYITEGAYKPVISAIMSYGPKLKFSMLEGSYCFIYTGSVDDAFPSVTLYFEDSLSLRVYPRDYLFEASESYWCIGWQNSGMQSKESRQMTILGDLVLRNKLVVYDLENQVIGWTDYNCSSSIKVQDDKTGAVYEVGAHNISFAYDIKLGRFRLFLSLLTASLLYFMI